MARDSWTDARFDDLNTKVDRGFEAVGHRFEQVDQRFEQVDQRFEQVDHRFEQVDHRFEQVDQRFGQVDRRFERLEDDIKDFRVEMNGRLDFLHQLLHSQNRLLIMSMIGLFSCMFTGFAGLIAAQIWA